MSAQRNHLPAIWAAVKEKELLLNAAGLLLSPRPQRNPYLRPVIALACALALCLLPMGSASEEAYTVISKLEWSLQTYIRGPLL